MGQMFAALCSSTEAYVEPDASDLVEDARRDLKDLKHSRVKVRELKKWKGDKPVDLDEGVIFSTYSLLVSGRGEKKHRLDQLVKWCGGELVCCAVTNQG